jgi:DNA-binding NtrC family response regulator
MDMGMTNPSMLIPADYTEAQPHEEQIESIVPWSPSADTNGKLKRFEEYEAEIFRFALAKVGGCVSHAAEQLGVGRATMYRKMRAYGIVAPPVSERAIDRSRKPKKDEQTAATETSVQAA